MALFGKRKLFNKKKAEITVAERGFDSGSAWIWGVLVALNGKLRSEIFQMPDEEFYSEPFFQMISQLHPTTDLNVTMMQFRRTGRIMYEFDGRKIWEFEQFV